jgi:hypothetical protein
LHQPVPSTHPVGNGNSTLLCGQSCQTSSESPVPWCPSSSFDPLSVPGRLRHRFHLLPGLISRIRLPFPFTSSPTLHSQQPACPLACGAVSTAHTTCALPSWMVVSTQCLQLLNSLQHIQYITGASGCQQWRWCVPVPLPAFASLPYAPPLLLAPWPDQPLPPTSFLPRPCPVQHHRQQPARSSVCHAAAAAPPAIPIQPSCIAANLSTCLLAVTWQQGLACGVTRISYGPTLHQPTRLSRQRWRWSISICS